MGYLGLTGPVELNQVLQGPGFIREQVPPFGTSAEKTLALVENCQTALGPCDLNTYLSPSGQSYSIREIMYELEGSVKPMPFLSTMDP